MAAGASDHHRATVAEFPKVLAEHLKDLQKKIEDEHTRETVQLEYKITCLKGQVSRLMDELKVLNEVGTEERDGGNIASRCNERLKGWIGEMQSDGSGAFQRQASEDSEVRNSDGDDVDDRDLPDIQVTPSEMHVESISNSGAFVSYNSRETFESDSLMLTAVENVDDEDETDERDADDKIKIPSASHCAPEVLSADGDVVNSVPNIGVSSVEEKGTEHAVIKKASPAWGQRASLLNKTVVHAPHGVPQKLNLELQGQNNGSGNIPRSPVVTTPNTPMPASTPIVSRRASESTSPTSSPRKRQDSITSTYSIVVPGVPSRIRGDEDEDEDDDDLDSEPLDPDPHDSVGTFCMMADYAQKHQTQSVQQASRRQSGLGVSVTAPAVPLTSSPSSPVASPPESPLKGTPLPQPMHRAISQGSKIEDAPPLIDTEYLDRIQGRRPSLVCVDNNQAARRKSENFLAPTPQRLSVAMSECPSELQSLVSEMHVIFEPLDAWTVSSKKIGSRRTSRMASGVGNGKRRNSKLGGAITQPDGDEQRNSQNGGQPRTTLNDMDALLGKNLSGGNIIRQDRKCLGENFLQSFVVTPGCRSHLIREFLGLFFIGYDLIVIPLDLVDLETSTLLELMNWIIRIFWSIDILMSFLTGRLDKEGGVDLRFRMVAWKYVTTWFPLDLIVVLVDWASSLLIGNARIGKLARVMRCLKLLRLVKAPEIEGLITEHIRSEQVILIADVTKNIVIMFCIAHVMACIWFDIGIQESSGWAKQLASSSVEVRYLTSFHWALAQFTGELIFDVESTKERFFAVCVLFFTFLISSLFISSITTSLTRLQIITSRESSQLSALKRYLGDNHISSALAVRVQRNAQHILQEQKRNAPEEEIILMKLISEPLRMEIHFEVHAPLILNHSFFTIYMNVNPEGIRKICHTSMHYQSVSKGDTVFSNLEPQQESKMLFICRGHFVYSQEDSVPVISGQGEWVCEASLWTKWIHCGTLRAKENSTLLLLEGDKFQRIISPYPTNHAVDYAQAFVDNLNLTARKENLTDMRLPKDQEENLLIRAFPEFFGIQELHRNSMGSNEAASRRPSQLSTQSPNRHHSSVKSATSSKDISKLRIDVNSSNSGQQKRPSSSSQMPAPVDVNKVLARAKTGQLTKSRSGGNLSLKKWPWPFKT